MEKLHEHVIFDEADEYRSELGVFAMAGKTSAMPGVIVDSRLKTRPMIFANDAFLAMTGFDRNALVAHPVSSLFGASADPETVALLENGIATGSSGQWQINLERANGTAFLAAVYLSPIHDRHGEVANHLVTAFDIASMLCISREKKEVYPAIYDSAPGFIAITNGSDHRFTYVNASYKTFVERDQLIGQTVAEALPEMVDQGLIATLDEVYQTGTPFRASQLPLKVWNAQLNCFERRWVDAVYQPVHDDSGAIIGLFCEGYDVTEHREAKRALAALEMQMVDISRVNAMGTMAATLAHELNQPLTAISNYLAGIRPAAGQAPDPDRMLKAFSGIKQASERAAGIIDHVRQLTKHRKPVCAPFNLRAAVKECVLLVRSSCSRDIAFHNRISADCVMTADPARIQQVLINLLQNACDALDDADNPQVTITANSEDRRTTLCIADNGPGVDAAEIATMFSWTETAKEKGMGIGLSICRTIIELHGGRIWLERSGPDGAQFCFCIPEQGNAQSAGHATADTAD